MAVKTAVSIPDRPSEAAERQARRRGIPRSQLYAEALSRMLAEQQSDEELTAAMDRVAEELDTGLDDFGKAAVQKQLAEAEW